MGWFDSIFDTVSDVVSGATDIVSSTVDTVSDVVSGTVDVVGDVAKLGADIVGDAASTVSDIGKATYDELIEPAASSTVEFVKENPEAVVAAATVASVAAGAAASPAIAAAIGKTGLLGPASTGTPISSLSGAALQNASLAKIGLGAKSVGGFGMAGGKTVISGLTGAVGNVASEKTVETIDKTK